MYRKRKKEKQERMKALDSLKKEKNPWKEVEKESFKATSYERRLGSQIRDSFPKDPERYVRVLKYIWNQAYKSPRKRPIMNKLWPVDNEIGKLMFKVGKYRSQKKTSQLQNVVDKIKKSYKSLRFASCRANLKWNEFCRATTMKKSSESTSDTKNYIRKLNMNEIQSIADHFQSDEATFPLPEKKYVGKRFMKSSLKKSLRMYNLLASTTRKIGMTTFRKYKPKTVKLVGSIPWRQSCCEVCTNFENIIEQGCKYIRGIPKTLGDCVDSSLCPYTSMFPKKECVFRTCPDCGVDKLKEKLIEQNSEKLHDIRKRFIVKQWCNKREQSTDKVRTFMHWRHDRFSYMELICTYVEMVETMSVHSFFASWNFLQYKECKNNLEEGEIIMVHDYAQNYLCKHQHEIQALHWSHAQVTLHPTCVSYRCPVVGCNNLVLHEVVHITSDLKHDAHLVKKFTQETLQVLKKRGVNIRKIIEFTDQAPSQYKNKSAFRYQTESNIPIMKNFFGVRHGKGPCDACTGRIKFTISALVKAGTVVINSAETLYEAAKKHIKCEWPKRNECCHYLVTFVLVPKLSTRPNTNTWKGIKDSRDEVHSVLNRNDGLKVNFRKIICLCPGCLHGSGPCENSKYTDAWQGFNMNTFKKIELDVSFWNAVSIRKIGGSRIDFNWQLKLHVLNEHHTFDELLIHCQRNPIPGLSYRFNSQLQSHEYDIIDLVAIHYRPEDAQQNLVPCITRADGNCFPRTLSWLCFHDQSHHIEMRVRLVYELVLNAHYYLSNRHMSRGASIVHRSSGPVQQVAMYSSSYNPQERLDVRKVFCAEVLDIAHEGSYCGLWQLAAASNVLRRPILSIYPDRNVNTSIRLDINRKFFCINNVNNANERAAIMWTPMQVSANSYPCHFVPMFKGVS